MILIVFWPLSNPLADRRHLGPIHYPCGVCMTNEERDLLRRIAEALEKIAAELAKPEPSMVTWTR